MLHALDGQLRIPTGDYYQFALSTELSDQPHSPLIQPIRIDVRCEEGLGSSQDG